MDKKQLEIILSCLKDPSLPKPGLEQYSVPGGLAAEILNMADLHGDINGKVVFDLGCGSGRLGIGAALLGARIVVGVDIDKKVLKIAKENSGAHVSKSIHFVCCDVKNWCGRCDTVIQNPPFGIQTPHADRLFLEKALECGKRVYSLHRGGYEKTREFVSKLVESNGGIVEQVLKFKFSIPSMFRFHTKPRVSYAVDLFVIEKSVNGINSC